MESSSPKNGIDVDSEEDEEDKIDNVFQEYTGGDEYL